MQDSIADGDFESGDDTEDDEISPSPLPSEHKAKSLLKTIFRPKNDESSFHGKSKYGKSASTEQNRILLFLCVRGKLETSWRRQTGAAADGESQQNSHVQEKMSGP